MAEKHSTEIGRRTKNIPLGTRFGKLVVVAYAGSGLQSKWECLCDCGKKIVVTGGSLRRERHGTKSCGCAPQGRQVKPIPAGSRFGKLVVIARSGVAWECRCDCGGKKIVRGASLRKGEVQSCGCSYCAGADVLDKIRRRVVVNANGCWEWRRQQRQGQATGRHRKVWTLVHGPIPDGLFLCHKCDFPPCCNPDHLFLGTQLDNMRDAAQKDRISHGQAHYKAKLTVEKAAVLFRRFHQDGEGYVALARIFGIGKTTALAVIERQTWRRATEKFAVELAARQPSFNRGET